MKTAEEHFMQRCLDLALNGSGYVAPNPMVGAVLTVTDEAAPYGQRIIGEGWHQNYGEAHAEVNAIAYVEEKELLQQATLYVNLEPCSHFGKTPPCADLVVEKQIPKIFIGTKDINSEVSGRGIEKLRQSGAEVVVGILEDDCQWLNRRFFTFHGKKRPYVVLKWAQTKDGFIAKKDFSSKWISNQTSRMFVHRYRSEEAAILVGFNTALHDDPALNVRLWEGKNPLKVVIDRDLKLEKTCKLFSAGADVVVFNQKKEMKEDNVQYLQINFAENLAEQVLKKLHKTRAQSVLIEGGSKTLQAFIDAGLWDEARVFTGTASFGEGISAPHLNMAPAASQNINDDKLNIYLNLPA